MPNPADIIPHLLSLPLSIQFLLAPFLLSALLLASTYVYTTLRYRLSLSSHLSPSANSKPLLPPPIPYTIPILGSGLFFLAPYPGFFWRRLFASHPRETGACTLELGGQTTHVLFDHTAIVALLKEKELTRERFNVRLLGWALGTRMDDVEKFYGIEDGEKRTKKEKVEKLVGKYLVKSSSVSELMDKFVQVMKSEVDEVGEHENVTGIAEWFRPRMLVASLTAVMGSRLLEAYPELTTDFWEYDQAIMSLFCGIPKVFIPKKHAARERMIAGFSRYHEQMWDECKGKIPDPDAIVWEPLYGSRYNRARQLFYAEQGMSVHGKATVDGGTIFGLGTNQNPAAGWMLAHILDPNGDETVYPRVMDELRTAQKSDGSLDCHILFGLPLLQSILHEALRLYTDTMIIRDPNANLILPASDGRRQFFIPRKSTVAVPSWVAHYNDFWSRNDAPFDKFYAERFLKHDPESGKHTFTLTAANGRFFPFGGGHEMCPGRVFAKQTMMVAVAITLLDFEIEPLCFIDGNGAECDHFPSFGKDIAGAGVVRMNGDLKVRLRRRTRPTCAKEMFVKPLLADFEIDFE